jgi:hypothetical protein
MGAAVGKCGACWHTVLQKSGVVKLLDKIEAQAEEIIWDKVTA